MLLPGTFKVQTITTGLAKGAQRTREINMKGKKVRSDLTDELRNRKLPSVWFVFFKCT